MEVIFLLWVICAGGFIENNSMNYQFNQRFFDLPNDITTYFLEYGHYDLKGPLFVKHWVCWWSCYCMFECLHGSPVHMTFMCLLYPLFHANLRLMHNQTTSVSEWANFHEEDHRARSLAMTQTPNNRLSVKKSAEFKPEGTFQVRSTINSMLWAVNSSPGSDCQCRLLLWAPETPKEDDLAQTTEMFAFNGYSFEMEYDNTLEMHFS